MKKCGIYMIFNLVSGKRYVGSSINIYNRFHEHIHILKRNEANTYKIPGISMVKKVLYFKFLNIVNLKFNLKENNIIQI